MVKVGRVYSVSGLNTTSSNQEHDSEIDSAEGFSNPTTPIGHPSNRSIIVLLCALFASVSNPMDLTFFKRGWISVGLKYQSCQHFLGDILEWKFDARCKIQITSFTFYLYWELKNILTYLIGWDFFRCILFQFKYTLLYSSCPISCFFHPCNGLDWWWIRCLFLQESPPPLISCVFATNCLNCLEVLLFQPTNLLMRQEVVFFLSHKILFWALLSQNLFYPFYFVGDRLLTLPYCEKG